MPTERRLRLKDRLPACPVTDPPPDGLLGRLPSWKDRLVLDHGCGDAHRRRDIEARGATYVGLDPYSSSSDLLAPGERIPLADGSVDVVVSNAVLHLVPRPHADVAEIGRVLKPGGWFVGYVGFLEGDPEQARFLFSHLGLSESLASAGLELKDLSVSATGIDFQLGNLLVPFGAWPFGQRLVRRGVRTLLRAQMGLLSAAFAWRQSRRDGVPFGESRREWATWFTVAHAAGFEFTARRPGAADAVSGAAPFDWSAHLRCPKTGARLQRHRRADVAGLAADAEPSASEWLVGDVPRCAHPVLGRQLALSADRCVPLRG